MKITLLHILHCSSSCKLASSDVSQSVGKVYGYNPPSTEHWFAVAGDKVGALYVLWDLRNDFEVTFCRNYIGVLKI